MRGSEALAALRRANRPFLTTQEAALILAVSTPSATQLLRGLADRGLIGHVRHGHWSLDASPKPIAYASWVTVPLPSYVSIHTALYQHGMIQQIPSVIYVVSLAKTQRIESRIGTYSVHQIAPTLFGGYDEQGEIRMATPEKAVFDFLYLSRGRSNLFAGLPEVEIPPGFRSQRVTFWVERVPDKAVRARVSNEVQQFLKEHDADLSR
jgi:predicted transcriptional regulator of viral defense system